MAPESDRNLEVARRYVALVANPATAFEDLNELLDQRLVWREMPNRFAPAGRTNDRAGAEASWRKGRDAVHDQRYIISSAVASGDTVALEIAWHGTVTKPLGPFAAGTTLSAELAMFLRFENGRIVSQTDYLCYHPT